MATRLSYPGVFSFFRLFLHPNFVHTTLGNCNVTYGQAVANGLWVVFENIDQAPSDVHSILLPLLEGQNSFATGHGEVTAGNLLHIYE